MKKFIATYHVTSPPEPRPAPTAEEKEAIMAPWMEWQKKYGDRIVDLGAPTMPGSASTDGSSWGGGDAMMTGYSIVSANDMAGAQEMFNNHPIYNYPGHQVQIRECADM